MNKITRPSDMQTPEVTTGPIVGSRKVYSSPEGHPDIRVPLREIALHESSGEPPFRTYDTSGPYTETDYQVDVEKGLPRHREAWVKERGGIETYQGRDIKPEDNGNATGKYLARDFPNKPETMRGLDGELVVGLAGDVFAHQRGVIKGKRRVAAPSSRVKRQLRRERIAVVPQDVPPRAPVPRAGGFRRDP